MSKKRTSSRTRLQELGRRERQIMEIIYRLGEGSVGDVLEKLPDPPSYSSVRTMIRLLESKGLLKHRSEGNKYFYRPTQDRKNASRIALRHVMTTFFGGSPADAVAAILDDRSTELSEADLRRLETMIDQARKEGK